MRKELLHYGNKCEENVDEDADEDIDFDACLVTEAHPIVPYESSAAECSITVQQANHDMDDISIGGKNNACPRWTIRDKKIWEKRFLHTNKTFQDQT